MKHYETLDLCIHILYNMKSDEDYKVLKCVSLLRKNQGNHESQLITRLCVKPMFNDPVGLNLWEKFQCRLLVFRQSLCLQN